MKIGSLEEFEKFLRNSTHVDPATGEERAYWIPLTAPNGATFKILQANGTYTSATFSDKNSAIVEQGGFWLDSIGFVAASKAEIDANAGEVADWLKKMWAQNGKDSLISSGTIPMEFWGMAIVDGHLSFVTINNARNSDVPENFPYKDRLLNTTNTPERNAQIVSAEFGLYLDASIKYGNNRTRTDITNGVVINGVPQLEPDSDLWVTAPLLCVAGYDCLGNIYGAPAWFISQDTSAQ